jgi:hypothetical protein
MCKYFDNGEDIAFERFVESLISDAREKIRNSWLEDLIDPPYDGGYEYDFPHDLPEDNWNWWFKNHKNDYFSFWEKLLDTSWPWNGRPALMIERFIERDR